MTAPGGRAGDAFIEFRAKTDKVSDDLERALEQAGKDADAVLDRVGAKWGDTVSDSMSDEIGKHGDDFAGSVERSMRGRIVTLGGMRFKLDANNMLHDVDTGRFAGKLVDDIVDSLENAGRSDGPLGRVGQGFADAIGAGFNVSGRSPLIAVLIPALGTIVALILGAVQAVNALIAVLTVVPGLISAIVLQAGTLVLAFKGVGTAIQGAFAATNATELHEAIKNLTPSAQNFVKSLLPLRDLFNQIQRIAQEGFFSAFGNTVSQIAAALGPIFTSSNFWTLAQALGTLFAQIGSFFASPTFVKFVNEIIPATTRWLGEFGPEFVNNMTAITRMATEAIPFLERVGAVVGNAFGTFTKWLNENIESGEFTDWLDRMGVTLDKLVELFFQAAEFVATFMEELDKAGGNEIIDTFADIFDVLSMVFSDDTAMRGLVNTVIFLTEAFAGLIIGIIAVIAFFQFLADAIGAFFSWLTGDAAEAVAKFFTEDFPSWVEGIANDVAEWFGELLQSAEESWNGVVNFFKNTWRSITNWFQDRVDDVTGFFTSIPGKLEQIGQSIMQGLRNGLQWGWDHTVGPLLSWITNAIPDWKGPLEKDLKLLQPAGRAVMQGFGEGLQQGADQMREMLTSFTGSLAGSADPGGGPITVNLGFHGALPTEDQAYNLGRAAGRGVQDQMTERDVALAVRVI